MDGMTRNVSVVLEGSVDYNKSCGKRSEGRSSRGGRRPGRV